MLPGLSADEANMTTSPLGSEVDLYHLGLLCMGIIMDKSGVDKQFS